MLTKQNCTSASQRQKISNTNFDLVRSQRCFWELDALGAWCFEVLGGRMFNVQMFWKSDNRTMECLDVLMLGCSDAWIF